MLPTMVIPIYNNNTTAVAAHEMHVIEDRLTSAPPHPAPYASCAKSELEMAPQMIVT